jgi:hypothetical protein
LTPIAAPSGSAWDWTRNGPLAWCLFGGEGSAVMLEIARSLEAAARPLQLILICGRNQKLAATLRAMPSRIPMFVEGFTREVPYYMHLSDFFIGKPGPGSISEAIAMKLPVIVERNAWNLPQERYNCEWVREQDVGLVLRNFRGIGAAVESCWSRPLTRACAPTPLRNRIARCSRFRICWSPSCRETLRAGRGIIVSVSL